jgi:uncharacterized protein YciI
MPRYVLTCIDKPESLALRMATREAHLAYARGHVIAIRAAGALLDEAGQMCGSHFLIDAEDAQEVRDFNEADPYSKAGLFGHVIIRLWRQALGAAI